MQTRLKLCALGTAAVAALAACATPPTPEPTALQAAEPPARTAPAAGYGLLDVRQRGWFDRLAVLPDPGDDAFILTHPMNPAAIALRVCDVDTTGSQRGFGAHRAIDGDPNTEWAAEGYRERSNAIVLDLCSKRRLYRMRIKTGPTRGAYYRAYLSDDGHAWRPASRRITTTGWQAYDVPLEGRGQFLLIKHFNRKGRVDHAAVFDVQVFGDHKGPWLGSRPGIPGLRM